MTQLKLPDIAAQTHEYALPLNWVGMCGIAQPVQFEGAQQLPLSMPALAW